MNSSISRQADWRQGWILVLSGFLPVMAILALAPTLPTLLAHFKGVGNPQLMVPLLLTTPSACIALLAPLAGVVTDRVGRRRLMLSSMLLYGIGGIVPFAFDDFWAVVGGRVLIGIAEAGILTLTNTLLADYFEEKARHRWLMIQGLFGSVAGAALIAASGFLASKGWQWPFAIYALAFPIFVAAWFYLYEPSAREARHGDAPAPGSSPFPWGITTIICGVTALISTIYFVQPLNFSLVLKDLGVTDPKAIGVVMAIPSLGVPCGSITFRFTAKYGATTQLTLALLLSAVGLLGIGFSESYMAAIAFAFFQQMANGIFVPGLIAWVQSRYDYEHRGRGMGCWSSAFFTAQFISPVTVAFLKGQAGTLQGAFAIAGAVAFAAAAISVARARLAPPVLHPQNP